MSGFRGKEIVDAHVRKYCIFFLSPRIQLIRSSQRHHDSLVTSTERVVKS